MAGVATMDMQVHAINHAACLLPPHHLTSFQDITYTLIIVTRDAVTRQGTAH